jgi:imidazole glycerol-phosphate synthase subunit HisF
MNYSNRLIPCLLISDEDMVKTRKFKKPIYIGDPINTAKIFNDKEVDELIVIDISCQKNKKEPNYKIIKELASECFMPLCYGGGITNMKIVDKLFSLGVEKICIQEAFFNNPDLINKIIKKYGSQSLVISVDIKKNILGKKKLYRSASNKLSKLSYSDYINKVTESGAGELLLCCVDNEGEMSGLDYELIKEIKELINIPLIVTGGVGNIEHIVNGFKAGANAVAVGSFFIFKGPLRGVLITYPTIEEINKINYYE